LIVAAIVAMIAAIPGLSAAGTPTLAPLTPAQLIAKVQQTTVTAFSGTLNLVPNLGIPNVSALKDAASGGGHGNGGFNPIDLLTGSNKALVWVDGPKQERVALLQSMAETDVVHNGKDIWLWDSTTKKVTHYTVTNTNGTSTGGADANSADTPTTVEPVKTPQQVADNLLAHLDPSTSVSVGTPLVVAKHDAYQLILTPKAAASTVDHVAIAIDSGTGFPLQVEVFAKGQTAAAITLGFGEVSLAPPAASQLAFTPPPGSTVTDKTLGGSHPAGSPTDANKGAKPADATNSGQPTTVGEGWASVAVFSNVAIPKQLNQYLDAASTVSGSFGSGRVLTTSLVNVLLMNDGRVAVGAVNVSTLEAAIASAP
jgi:outer membrane lipoprotein-sorting protein